MMSRKRVLFFAEAVTLAHVARANVLARCLDPEEFDVHVAWDPRYNSLLGDLPFAFHPIRSLPTGTFLRRLARGAPMHDAGTLRGYVDEDLRVIDAVSPDVIVGDFRISLAASARLRRIPLVAIANAYWSPYGRQDFVFPEYDYPLSGLVGSRLAQRLFHLLRPIGFAAHTRPLNRVLREHGLPGIGSDIRVMYTFGDYTAYADIPELSPVYGAPENHSYIGPVLWSPATDVPSWWDDLPGDRPIIYVTLGSSGEQDILPVVLGALADLPVTVIGATAGRIRVDNVPSNARVADYLPGINAAARSDLVICNGGSPTTYQALVAGVPVVGLVSNNMDQQLNMAAVRRAGAGEVLRARSANVQDIRRVVLSLIGSARAAQSAAGLARSASSCQPTVRFPRLVEQLAGTAERT
jgi:UDP:flavonoid glycosyltransferase YjiC (YdhE family)